jgi:hypothetical protein
MSASMIQPAAEARATLMTRALTSSILLDVEWEFGFEQNGAQSEI